MASEPRLQRRSWAAVAARVAVLIVGFVCMVAFAVVLAKATLVPSPASVRFTHTNLHPGSSIRAYLAQPDWRDAVKQVGGNVVLGMPFGVLLPVLFPRARGLVRVVLMTAFVMLTVEVAQGLLVTGRAFDIDDVILNSTGAFAGYLLLGRRLGRALHPRRHHWWQRRPAEAGVPEGRQVEAADASSPDAGDLPPTSKSRLPAILRAVRKPVR
ncbi:VanZ family protein [Streptomyces xanthochromogenes]|uniref:VanZ family protein n=1 Tax=Streptomyces xanthochromogenes TaxID=67384 RepID=UPI0038134F41